MCEARRYWMHVRLEGSGRTRKVAIEAAQQFFQQVFPDWDTADRPDTQVQRRLVQIMRCPPDQAGLSSADIALAAALKLSPAALAEGCLRCFISHQIPQVCYSLEQQFGARGNFRQDQLLPYVMEDANPLQSFDPLTFSTDLSRPLAVTIVQKFDPERSNLSTWTKLLTRQHKELLGALRDVYGIYISSDWAVLNQTKPEQAQRLLAGILSTSELTIAIRVLKSYHQVYLPEYRLWKLHNVGKPCPDPTPQQLAQMLRLLPPDRLVTSPEAVLRLLKLVAQKLRPPAPGDWVSIDDPVYHNQSSLDCPTAEPEDSSPEQDFLASYRPATEALLQQVVNQMIAHRAASLKRRKPKGTLPEDQAYLKAMALFHHDRLSMTDIAPKVDRQEQYQVSRLLALSNLKADVHREWLLQMVQHLPQLLTPILDPEQRRHLSWLDQPLDPIFTAFWPKGHNSPLLPHSLSPSPSPTLSLPASSPLSPCPPSLLPIEQPLSRCLVALNGLITPIIAEYTTENYNPERTKKLSPPSQDPNNAGNSEQPLSRGLLTTCICRYLEDLGVV